jgi:hypothetical protein
MDKERYFLGIIDQLKTENAKLRVERDEWRRVAVSKQDIIDHMRDANAENAKLRELVQIAIEYCVNGYCAEEDECPLYESRHSCRLYAKARELGVVEVDG